MKTCPFCFKEDLVDQATKCPHCAAWLTGGDESRDGIEKLRQEVRQEFKNDLKSHRDYLNSLLNRVQWVASVILVLVIAAAAFFGIRTDQSITEITASITDHAEKKITEQVENEFGSEKMKGRIETEIEVASENIKKVINDSVVELNSQAEQQVKQFTDVSEEWSIKITALREKIDPTIEKLDEIETLADRAKAAAKRTKDAILGAAKAPVDKRLASLPVDTIELSAKEGIHQIRGLMEKRVNALSFRLGLGGYYYGPAVWLYFANLSKLPEFRYAVILNNDNSLFGILDARGLVSALNPPNAGELAEQYPLSGSDLPDQIQVSMWTQFADQLNAGDTEALKNYPAFVSRDKAIPLGWDKQKVLDRMEELRVEWLPVIDEEGQRFVGIIDRSRLTTSLVLEIAKGLK